MHVKYFGYSCGRRKPVEVEVDFHGSLLELVSLIQHSEDLDSLLPDNKDISFDESELDRFIVMVNNEHFKNLDGWNTMLKSKDRIVVLPRLTGG